MIRKILNFIENRAWRVTILFVTVWVSISAILEFLVGGRVLSLVVGAVITVLLTIQLDKMKK